VTGARARPRRESFAERKERRAAVDDPAVVLEAAARFLEARSRSVHEVRRRLGGAGYQTDLIEGAIERMTELGMLDDEVFARAWVESRDRVRPRGERAIREELRLKGIDRATIDVVLAERRERAAERSDAGVDGDLAPVSADRTAAERLLAKHARALARVADPRQRRQRAYGLLARHGFDPETCREVAATLADAPDDGSG
jgi:regulatory protein